MEGFRFGKVAGLKEFELEELTHFLKGFVGFTSFLAQNRAKNAKQMRGVRGREGGSVLSGWIQTEAKRKSFFILTYMCTP